MGLLSNIKSFFDRRKQLKLDKAREEKIKDLKTEILSQIEEVCKENLPQLKKAEKIYRIIESERLEAKELGIIEDRRDTKGLANLFGENEEIKNAVYLVEKDDTRRIINGALEGEKNLDEIMEMLDGYIKDFESTNEWQVFSAKQKYELLEEIIEEKTSEDRIDDKKVRLETIYKNYYISHIAREEDPKKLVQLYDEYVTDILNNDEEQIKEFKERMEDFGFDIGILRKVSALKELGTNVDFKSVDRVPELYDMTKEEVDEEKNEELARKKIKEGFSLEDLVYIRTTEKFPTDGVVETVGGYSGYEDLINPIGDALKNVDSTVDLEKIALKIPRHRATSHWCINGVVGDHTMNTFSGRDYFLIEDATEHEDDSNLISARVEDTIFLGDMKLSPKAKIAMSVDKYLELASDVKQKKQIEKMNIVLYKGDPKEALKVYLNEKGYVWGIVSSYGYVPPSTFDKPTDKYLPELEAAIKNDEIKGIDKCAHINDEGLQIENVKNPESQEKMREVALKSINRMGIKIDEKRIDQETFKVLASQSLDNYLTDETAISFIEYLESTFPEMENLQEKFMKIGHLTIGEEVDDFNNLVEKAIRQIGVDKVLDAIDKFNQKQLEKERKERRAKNLELLGKGFITEEEYYDRISDSNDRKNNAEIEEQKD